MSNTNLPTTKRFYSEDFKESPQWFQRFLSQLDLFTEPIYNILNGGVNVSQNTLEEFYTLQVNNASATAISNATSFLPKKYFSQPVSVLISQCLLNSTTGVATAVGAQVTLDWVWTGSQIKILAIYGLTASSNYTFTLRIT